MWETLADYPEARASLTERGCQLLRKDGLLDETVFASKYNLLFLCLNIQSFNEFNLILFTINLDAQQQQDSLELGVTKLECTVENLNLRLARLLGEYASSQAKLKQRISRLEEKYENEKNLTIDEMNDDDENMIIEKALDTINVD